MIVVKVELWPGGNKESAISLGMATIINDGLGTNNKRHYDISVYSRGDNPRRMLITRLENWNSNIVSAWRTVYECLKRAFEPNASIYDTDTILERFDLSDKELQREVVVNLINTLLEAKMEIEELQSLTNLKVD